MKTRLLLASASALALTWGATAQAENVGIGVLEPQAVLHVRGETADDNDVIFQNMDAYDGTADTENVLLIDEDDGQRVKTIALTDMLTDTTLENSDFSFNTTTNVLSITTNAKGRFHLPCELATGAIGRNLVLKLDRRTLPQGYKVTSENPRAIRITQGKMTKLHFATTRQREIQLDIDDCNFIIPSDAPIQDSALAVLNPVWEERLEQLIDLLEARPARLVISYTGGPSMTKRLIQTRVKQAQDAISTTWNAKQRPYRLRISTQVQRYFGQEAPPCEPAFLAGIIGLNIIEALPPNTRPLTHEALEKLFLEPGFTAVEAPDGRTYLLATKDAPGSSPRGRSDHVLPPGSRRIDDPVAFGLTSVPDGLIAYITPTGALRLIKPAGTAPSFVPVGVNPG